MAERLVPFPTELDPHVEMMLLYEQSGEYRWKNGKFIPRKQEHDEDHVYGMFDLLDEISVKYPRLFMEFDVRTVQRMILIHDIGELVAGDLTHSHPDYDFLRPRVKECEKEAGIQILSEVISDPDTCADYIDAYVRCTETRNDKEALFVNLIDKIQAGRFGIEHVFHGRRINRSHRQMQLNHGFEIQYECFSALKGMVSGEAQSELQTLLQEGFWDYTKHGFKRREVLPYIQKINSFFNNKQNHSD